LLKEREKRIHPGLDDKQLTSWNGLMIKGYCDAYDAFAEQSFLNSAIKCANHILTEVKQSDGGLYHNYKNGKASINGYLEDYSFMIEALVALYQSTFDEHWLDEAKKLTDYTIAHFFDESSSMFWFTSDTSPALIARKKEIGDNVIPASNSSMAKALFYLGNYFSEKKYTDIALQMLNNVKDAMAGYGSSYSNWAILMLHHASTFNEVVITGKDAEQKRQDIAKHYLPNKILAGAVNDRSKLPLLENRYSSEKTLIYVCENQTCKLPVEEVNQAILSIR
jgi:uncharacterized protein